MRRALASMGRLSCSALLLVGTLATGASPPAPKETEPGRERWHILIQSELDYLTVKDRQITVEFENASPADVLSEIGKKAGIAIEVQGKLQGELRLTGSFRKATVKQVLVWFAERTEVSYRAEWPARLRVIVPASPRVPADL